MNMCKKQIDRLGEKTINKQGCLMQIIEYYDTNNIVVEFQDIYKSKVHSSYRHFKNGSIKNPYYPSVHNIGIVGNKYRCSVNRKITKEYKMWQNILNRCYNDKYKKVQPTYKNASCCKDWLLFDNFYEWLHEQENFDKLFSINELAIDKDILIKGNKLYSPETCCLVPQKINNLFTKQDCNRGNLPIGVTKRNNKFRARCDNMLSNKLEIIGTYDTPEKAFEAYKKFKENLIKQIAQEEYDNGNITKQCYNAMMNYEVEITD